MNTLRRLDGPVSAWPLALALLPVLLLMLFPVRWNSNEEGYFQYAYQTVAPAEFPEHSAIFDRSPSKFAFRWTVGGLVAAVGYENAWTIARLLMAAMYACGLGLLFAAMGVSIVEAVAIVGVFHLAGEQLYGGEWLFRGVEAKTFGYAFVAAAIGLRLTGRRGFSAACIVAATYAHFLVGGFWMLVLFFLELRRSGRSRELLSWLAVCLLLVMPLVGVVIFDQAGAGGTTDPDAPTTNEIYAMRNPHHVAPFADVWDAWGWTPGVVFAALLFVLFVVWAYLDRKDVWPFMLAGLLGYLLVAFLAAFLDRDTNLLAKFYIFRPSSFTLLLVLTVLVRYFRSLLSADRQARALSALLLLAIAGPAFWSVAQTKIEEAVRGHPTRAQVALKDAVLERSAPGDVVLLEADDRLDPDLAMLPRYLERPTLVSFIFPPTNPTDMQRWYRRLQFRRELFASGCTARLAYPVRWLAVFERETLATVASCGPVVWERGSTALVRVDESWQPRAAGGRDRS